MYIEIYALTRKSRTTDRHRCLKKCATICFVIKKARLTLNLAKKRKKENKKKERNVYLKEIHIIVYVKVLRFMRTEPKKRK